MGIFGHKPKAPAAEQNTQEFHGLRFNESVYGSVVPVLIGPNRVPLKIIWAGDWQDHVTTTPGTHVGKGLGGGSTTPGTTSHTYTQAVQALLGPGFCDHIGAH